MSDSSPECPCTSGKSFADCCEPYISGAQIPETAEAMMRARYTAHTRVDMDFVIATHHPDSADDINTEGTRQWAEQSDWLGMEVLRVEKGGTSDKSGKVEFVARAIGNATTKSACSTGSTANGGFAMRRSPRFSRFEERPRRWEETNRVRAEAEKNTKNVVDKPRQFQRTQTRPGRHSARQQALVKPVVRQILVAGFGN